MLCAVILAHAQGAAQTPQTPMTIDIWSDISCPFCYLGKRHIELALERLQLQVQVQVVWHSF
ncbi:MAG: DsbA family protein, partial [Bacteroidota bacterium]